MSTIGVVAPYDLANIYSGSVQRIKSDLIALSSSGFNVEVLFPSSTNRWLWEPLDSQELPIQLVPLPYPGIQKVPFFPQKAKLIFDAHTQFINPFCRFKLRRHASKYRVVFAHFPASFVASWFALSKKTVPIIYVAHDCEYSLIKQSTRNPLIHALMYRFERFACSKASKILCVSELDMHELQYTYDIPSEKMAVLPNTVDTHSLSETLAVYDKAEERHNLGISASSFVLLFHGRMDYRPNMDALRFILDELVPVLHHSHLTLKILVAGAQVPKWCFDYENKIVSFYSDVPDMRRFLAVADAIIVPLFAGGGTRLKVLEAFAARVPVISTAKGVEGIRCKDRHDILIADETAEDFARNIETLAMSESLKTHLIENSYWLVQKEYGVEAAGKCLRQVVNEIGG